MRDGFEKAFISTWNNFHGYDTPDLILVAKLKWVKEAINKWRLLDYSKEEVELKILKNVMDKLDYEAESRLLTDAKLETRRNIYKELLEKEKWQF